MTGDNAAENVTTGVERVLDLLEGGAKPGSNDKVEKSIRSTLDKITAIGRL